MSLIIFILIFLCICIWIYAQRDKFILNSDSLHKQWLFRLAVVFPLVSSLYFIVWLSAPYPPRWDAYGYNTFLEINKFSLGILALSPILGAFVVSAHRSIQTTKQIEVTEKKNKVDIYFSERKFIIEQLENIHTLHYGKINNANNTYDKFIEFDNYNNKLIKDRFTNIDSKINEIYNSFTCIEKYTHKNIDDILPSEEFNFRIELKNIIFKIKFILNSCGMENNKPEIFTEINEFFKNGNVNILHEGIGNYISGIELLLSDITDEIIGLYYFLHKLFTIILLNKDISEFLPNLEKINPKQFP